MKRMRSSSTRSMLLLLAMLTMFVLSGCKTEKESIQVNVGSLKGPTSMGLVSLMEKSEALETKNNYSFKMETAADALLTGMVKGELDIALVPANVASVLYQKTEGQIAVIDINTLSVLYMVSADPSLQSFENLKGRTIYLTGVLL